ncbi:MAG TPA: hypothetical protein VNW97_08640 [Candidatus Saccharimonadales bacterium]|jgi:hypothetical protein|nr:hypothetical protein [Candidatus Saccharimonadales bacterium]
MKSFLRFTSLALFIFSAATFSFGQAPDLDGAAATAKDPGYARVAPVSMDPAKATVLEPVTAATIIDFPLNATTSRAIFSAGSGAAGDTGNNASSSNSPAGRSDSEWSGDDRRPNRPSIDGLDSVATFSGAYINQAGPSLGRLFPFIMMGNHPLAGGTTVIPAQITTVNLRLLNADGTLNVNVPFKFRDLLEDSPNFEEHNYRSGRHIQYGDAVHRAQFFHTMGRDWHTVLRPSFVNDVTFTIPRFVNVRFADGSVKPVQAYRLGTAADGNHFVLMLDLLFNFLFSNQVVSDINAGNFTTNALSTTMLPNTFLFSINNQGQFAGCCVLGFHTFFFIPNATPQPRWVTQFASWISPGIFGGGFEDVTALSHETAEAFGDPFVNNTTASWQFPGVPANAKICQNNLEEGDPIEVLSNATVPIKLREGHEVFTYHPQNIPLLQWFEMGAKSNAIDGAFSFPDETALPHSALPCPM